MEHAFITAHAPHQLQQQRTMPLIQPLWHIWCSRLTRSLPCRQRSRVRVPYELPALFNTHWLYSVRTFELRRIGMSCSPTISSLPTGSDKRTLVMVTAAIRRLLMTNSWSTVFWKSGNLSTSLGYITWYIDKAQ